MEENLEKALFDKYPKIFRQKDLSMQVTCMCWGIDTGDGWYNIIDQLCANIQWRIDNRRKSRVQAYLYNRMLREAIAGKPEKLKKVFTYGTGLNEARYKQVLAENTPDKIPPKIHQVEATQVKEKFGGLRFYYQGGDDVIDGMVRMAESMADVTCDVCGAPGDQKGSKGWLATRCKKHKKNK